MLRAENHDAALLEQFAIALYGRVAPHHVIHCGSNRDLRFGGQAQRGQQVRRGATRKPRHDFRGRRRNQHDVCPAREFDMTHCRFGFLVPQVAPNGPARYGLQGRRRDELLCRCRHDDLHVGATAAQTPHELGRLVRGDAACYAKYDVHRVCSPAAA